jgi:hypothetical protein
MATSACANLAPMPDEGIASFLAPDPNTFKVRPRLTADSLGSPRLSQSRPPKTFRTVAREMTESLRHRTIARLNEGQVDRVGGANQQSTASPCSLSCEPW